MKIDYSADIHTRRSEYSITYDSDNYEQFKEVMELIEKQMKDCKADQEKETDGQSVFNDTYSFEHLT